LVQLEALNLGIKLLVLNIYKPYVNRIPFWGSLSKSEVLEDPVGRFTVGSKLVIDGKISDGKDQR
jgi:hypothetical protein